MDKVKFTKQKLIIAQFLEKQIYKNNLLAWVSKKTIIETMVGKIEIAWLHREA